MEKGYNWNCRKHWAQFVFSIKSEIRWQRHRWSWYKVVDYHLKCSDQKRDKMLPDPRRREAFKSEWLSCLKETNPYRSRKFSNLRKEQTLNWITLVGLQHQELFLDHLRCKFNPGYFNVLPMQEIVSNNKINEWQKLSQRQLN